jgi:hypothetical protein
LSDNATERPSMTNAGSDKAGSAIKESDMTDNEMPTISIYEAMKQNGKMAELYRTALLEHGFNFAWPDFGGGSEPEMVVVPPVNEYATGIHHLMANVIGYPQHLKLTTPLEKAHWIEWMWKHLKAKCERQEAEIAELKGGRR